MILKICCGTWENASRDKRELSTYRELGYDVRVVAKGKPDDFGRKDEVSGFEVIRLSTQPFGDKVPRSVNHLFSFFAWARYVRKEIKPDIISGHDLSGLAIAFISNIGRRNKSKLIYDSHEFEIGRNAKRNKLQKCGVVLLERFLIKQCAFSIVVNESIADEIQRIHRLEKRPIVVRNIPNYWEIDESACKEMRQRFFEALGDTHRNRFLVLYHGEVTQGRGIEKILEAVSIDPNIAAIILGNGSQSYVEQLKSISKKYEISNKVLFHPAVSINELWKYIGAVDVGLVTIPPITKSYYYMLPNKFFENIQSETPIIGSDFPEIRQLVDLYNIGLLCNPDKLEEIVECIEKMRTDKLFYEQCKVNTQRAKIDLCWEKEKDILKHACETLL